MLNWPAAIAAVVGQDKECRSAEISDKSVRQMRPINKRDTGRDAEQRRRDARPNARQTMPIEIGDKCKAIQVQKCHCDEFYGSARARAIRRGL